MNIISVIQMASLLQGEWRKGLAWVCLVFFFTLQIRGVRAVSYKQPTDTGWGRRNSYNNWLSLLHSTCLRFLLLQGTMPAKESSCAETGYIFYWLANPAHGVPAPYLCLNKYLCTVLEARLLYWTISKADRQPAFFFLFTMILYFKESSSIAQVW